MALLQKQIPEVTSEVHNFRITQFESFSKRPGPLYNSSSAPPIGPWSQCQVHEQIPAGPLCTRLKGGYIGISQRSRWCAHTVATQDGRCRVAVCGCVASNPQPPPRTGQWQSKVTSSASEAGTPADPSRLEAKKDFGRRRVVYFDRSVTGPRARWNFANWPWKKLVDGLYSILIWVTEELGHLCENSCIFFRSFYRHLRYIISIRLFYIPLVSPDFVYVENMHHLESIWQKFGYHEMTKQ